MAEFHEPGRHSLAQAQGNRDLGGGLLHTPIQIDILAAGLIKTVLQQPPEQLRLDRLGGADPSLGLHDVCDQGTAPFLEAAACGAPAVEVCAVSHAAILPAPADT
jgi:hypothetical protein